MRKYNIYMYAYIYLYTCIHPIYLSSKCTSVAAHGVKVCLNQRNQAGVVFLYVYFDSCQPDIYMCVYRETCVDLSLSLCIYIYRYYYKRTRIAAHGVEVCLNQRDGAGVVFLYVYFDSCQPDIYMCV